MEGGGKQCVKLKKEKKKKKAVVKKLYEKTPRGGKPFNPPSLLVFVPYFVKEVCE